MKNRIFSISISIIIMLSFVFSAFQTTPALAQVSSGDGNGGNPVQPDEATSTTPASLPEFDKNNLDLNKQVRVIVQLEDSPVASYAGGVEGYEATTIKATGAVSLDMAQPNVASYENYLVAKQTNFANTLEASLPDAKVERSYQVVLNALTVNTRVGDIQKIRELSGVKNVTVEQEHKLQMDSSLPLIGLGSGTLGGEDWTDSGLWQTLGGHANAGAGIRIADIDSGITPSNPCFDPTGYTYPSSAYPKGEKDITNPKIIVARSYFRASDPPYFPATALDDPGNFGGGHGDHTAGTIACNYGTTTTFSNLKISGVAPKAQLMVYRVFYHSLAGSESAYTPELIAAIEDAVKDGAQVVNNSWGGTDLNTVDDPEVAAYEAAADAGVVVVFSAGNSGPGEMTIGNPGAGSEKFITVAASTTSRTFITDLENTARSDSETLFNKVIHGRSITQTAVTAPIVDLQVGGYADSIACNGAIPSEIASGKIVVVRRGTCALVDKVVNAKAGGAVGVVIRNISGGTTTLPLINPVLPTIHINQTDGDALATWIAGLPAGVTATFKINPAIADPTGDAKDTLASFSSLGPTPDLQLKPDISAPGVNILSSVSAMDYGSNKATFSFYDGTSMAAPHITGATALLKQIHPDWTPAQIKSALMSTADEPVDLGDNPAYRGAGRLSLTGPDKVELTFDKPSLSFGLTTAGNARSITVSATNMTASEVTYNLAVNNTTGPVPVLLNGSSSITSLTVPANGIKAFTVQFTPSASGDSYGSIVLTKAGAAGEPGALEQSDLHIPYFSRSVDGTHINNVYLVDGDGSGLSGCTDYQAVYKTTLDTLRLTYTTVDLYINSFDLNQARLHNFVLYFEGDPGCNSKAGGKLSSAGNNIRNYLAQGGRMIIMGQDIGFRDYYSIVVKGLTFTPGLFFGAKYVQDDLLNGAPLQVAGDPDYSPFMGGMVLPLDETNTSSVDEISPELYGDADALPILANKLAPAAQGSSYKGGMGTRMSSEPTIERVKGTVEWTRLPYRTIFTSFGLENIKESGSSTYRVNLLTALVKWLKNQTNVEFSQPAFYSPSPSVGITLTGNGQSTFGDILYYRVDFGDGSPVQVIAPGSTGKLSVNYKYQNWGEYKIYVEAVDTYGQKAVDSANAKVGVNQYIPFITR